MKVIGRLIVPLIFLGGMIISTRYVLHEWKAYESYEGNGTKENPHLIYTAEQLNQLRQEVNNGLNTSGLYFELMNDIDLKDFDADLNKKNGNWIPIGYSEVPDSLFKETEKGLIEGTKENIQYVTELKQKEENYKAFSGTFNGNGHTIKNINIVSGEKGSVGFFGNVSGAVIENLTFKNVEISGVENVGSLAGTVTDSTIHNITVKGDVDVDGDTHIGSLIGAVGKDQSIARINGYDVDSSLDSIGEIY